MCEQDTSAKWSFRRPLALLGVFVGLLTGLVALSPATPTDAQTPNTVTIVKDAVPNDLQDFTFTSGPVNNQCPPPTFLLDDDASVSGADNVLLDSVTYPLAGCNFFNTFAEIVPAGWILTNIVCVVQPANPGTGTQSAVSIGPIGGPFNATFEPGDNQVNIDLAADEAVTCTFTNEKIETTPSATATATETAPPSETQTPVETATRTAEPVEPCTITINKLTDPPGGTGFNFSSAWNGLQGITLDHGQSITKTVPCGPIFNIYEIPLSGWILTNIVCTITGGAGVISINGANPNPAFQPGDTQVVFHSMTPGSDLSCTFTNTRRIIKSPVCTITITKHTNPASTTPFTFNVAGAGFPATTVTLVNGQSQTITVPCASPTNPAVANTYTVTETLVNGFWISNVLCGLAPGGGSMGFPSYNTTSGQLNIVEFQVALTGSIVNCSYTNTETPGPCTITIHKITSPAGGTGFNFSSAWSGLQGITLNDGGSVTKTVPCGPIFNLFEAPLPGYTLTNIACSFTAGTGSFNIIGANVSPTNGFEAGDNEVSFFGLSPGAALSCTFTNQATPRPCTVTISKRTNPAGGTGFPFGSSLPALNGVILDDGQSITVKVPCDTTANVFEIPLPGWVLTNITCVLTGVGSFSIIGANANPAFQAGDDEVTFTTVAAGSNLSCVFTNEKQEKEPGSITICKHTDPAGGTGFTFGWSAPLIRTIPFTLDDQHCVTFSGLAPGDGPYSFWEIPPLPPGWVLSNIVCTGGANILIGANGVYDPGDTGVTINLGPGENVVCTFTNSHGTPVDPCPPGTAGYTVIKDISTGQSGPPGTQDLNWNRILPAGPAYSTQYAFPYWQAPPAGTNWINHVSSGSNVAYIINGTYTFQTSFFVDTVNYSNFKLSFQWAADDDVNIDLNGNTIANGGSWSLLGPAVVTTFGPFSANVVNNLTAKLDNIPVGYSPTGLLIVGKVTACRKVPVEPACITIVKNAVPDDPQDFNFTWNGPSFVLDDDAALPNPSATPNSKTLCDLTPGATHTITETPVAPWVLVGINCSQTPSPWAAVGIGPGGGPYNATFAPGENSVQIVLPATLPSGGHVTCVFVNRKLDKPGCITIIKDRTPNSSQDYLFQGHPWPGTFTLDDDPQSATPNTATLCDLTANAVYNIGELGAVPPPPPVQPVNPTALVNIICTVTPASYATVVFLPSGMPTFQAGDTGVKITIGPSILNGNVTCTFVNAPVFSPLAFTDSDCDGDEDGVDLLNGLKHLAGLELGPEAGCPPIGGAVLLEGDTLQVVGDFDCDGDVDLEDTLLGLRRMAGAVYTSC